MDRKLKPHIKCLIVDDNETDRLIVRSILKKLGVLDVHEAENGSAAEFKIDNWKQLGKTLELVVVDWNMPVMNGPTLIKALRTHKETRHAKIMMMTGRPEEDQVREALRVGIDDFAVKPINLATFEGKLAKLIELLEQPKNG